MDYGDYNKEHSERKQRNYANAQEKILSFILHIHALIFVCVTIKKCGTNSY